MKPFVVLIFIFIQNVLGETIPTCDSKIYCQGQLLDMIQYTQKLYNDSKTFVDFSLQFDPDVVLFNFDQLMVQTNNTPSKLELAQFVRENFINEDELENWTPTDYKDDPAFLQNINNTAVRNFAKDIVAIWPTLGKKCKDTVKLYPDRHSAIYLPNGFIIPGGRFREAYYWDSYWIIKGLLISEMTQTVRGMLENFFYLVRNYGFIPNGSRIYYTKRSEPPLLSLMVGLYIDETNDTEWLRKNIETVEDELKWWLNNRIINITQGGTTYRLARYACESNTPRSESYSEDVEACRRFKSKAKESCYKNLKSGAESGWDFSSRWIFDPNATDISYINVYRIVPVDLNSYLCKSFKELSRFYTLLNDTDKAAEWRDLGNEWQQSIEAALFDKFDGIWYDYDISAGGSRKGFYPSNFAPLWTGAFDESKKSELGAKAAKYFKNTVNMDYYLGGIPTSLTDSGLQWDLPNAWPPLQEIVILGLYKTGDKDARDIAQEYTRRWIIANMIGYSTNGAMFEKYDAVVPGQYGGGGEYQVQAGFGWTNGVVFSLLNEFSDLFTDDL